MQTKSKAKMVTQYKFHRETARSTMIAATMVTAVMVITTLGLSGCGQKDSANSAERALLEQQSAKIEYAAKHPEIQEQKNAAAKANATALRAKCSQQIKDHTVPTVDCGGPKPAPGAS